MEKQREKENNAVRNIQIWRYDVKITRKNKSKTETKTNTIKESVRREITT
jgi:hypothetical protein